MGTIHLIIFRIAYWIVALAIIAGFCWMAYWLNVADSWIEQFKAIEIAFAISGASLGTLFMALNLWGIQLYEERRIRYTVIGIIMFGWIILSIYALLTQFS